MEVLRRTDVMSNKKIEEIAGQYIGSWNELTFENIKSSLEKCCVPEITYIDKQTPMIHGLDQLANLILSTHYVMPGRVISIHTAPECFDNYGYYSWLFTIADKVQLIGRDYFEYNDDNLITRVVAFLPV